MEPSLKSLLLVRFSKLSVTISLHHFAAGTAVLLKPGIISGGRITHECPLSRSIGYFLEPVVMLAPFSKKPLQLTIRGITTDEHDLSVSCSTASRISDSYP